MKSTTRKSKTFKATIKIPEEYREIWESFVDPNMFIEMCLKDASGIMAWSIARSMTPIIKHPVPDEWKQVIDQWNKLNPEHRRKTKDYIEVGGL